MLHNMFGDPPFKPVGALKAEHYAALVAEYERDPYQRDLWTEETEPENSTAGDGVQGPPDKPGLLRVSPENAPADDSPVKGA